jgi:hypothetical protein
MVTSQKGNLLFQWRRFFIGIIFIISFCYSTQGRDWSKDKWKEKESNKLIYETHTFIQHNPEKESENESEWQGLPAEINLTDGNEMDAPANPDDPDAPIDRQIILLVFAGLFLGFKLKYKRLQNS